MAEYIPLYTCTTLFLSIHLPMDTGRFHVLAIVNSVAVNTWVYVPFRIIVFSEYTPRSGIAGSSDNSIFSFFEEPICYFS